MKSHFQHIFLVSLGKDVHDTEDSAEMNFLWNKILTTKENVIRETKP